MQSVTLVALARGQAATRDGFRAKHERTGNLHTAFSRCSAAVHVKTFLLGERGLGLENRRVEMSEDVSRRKALSLLVLGAALGFTLSAALAPSEAEAQETAPAAAPAATGTHGMNRRHSRRHGRHERRETRRGHKPAAATPAGTEAAPK
jgi:hypothetical protein